MVMVAAPVDDAPAASRGIERFVVRALLAFSALALVWLGLNFYWKVRSADLLASAQPRVVHADGAPAAGMEVWVLWTTPMGREERVIAACDAAGRVDLSPLGGASAFGARFTLEVSLLGYDEQHVLAPTTVITLPPVGRVRLRVVDGRGRPYSSLRRHSAALRSARCDCSLPYGEDGTIDFGLAVCGSRLKLLARAQGMELRPEDARDAAPRGGPCEVEGPAEPGSVREIVCRIPDDAPRLRAVVVDADGHAAAGEYGLGVHVPGSDMSAFTVATDAAGRFDFLLTREARGDGTLELFARDGRRIVAPCHATPRGDLEAGTVRLPRAER